MIELVGPRFNDSAIDHLRMGGGNCKLCHDPIQPTDQMSMGAHLTSAGGSVGFVQLPLRTSQVLDDRRSRCASLRMAHANTLVVAR